MAEFPEERLGPKKTLILAIGAAAGVLITNQLIHVLRQPRISPIIEEGEI